MRIFSYVIIAVVISVIAWSTEEAITKILKQDTIADTYTEKELHSTEVETVPSMLEELLGS